MTHIINPYRFAGGGFDFEEYFEGSNTDSLSQSGYDLTGWTAGPNAAAVDPNQTTITIEGSYSLELKQNASSPYDAGHIYRTVTTNANYYLKMRMDLGYLSANTTDPIIAIRDSGGTVLAKMYWQYDGAVIASGGKTASDFAHGFSQGSSVYCWFEYEAGGGANSKCRFYIASTDSKPTANCSIADGNETSDAAQIYLANSQAVGQNHIFDSVQGDISAIG